MINWKKDKTNGDYLNEMKNSVNYQLFKKCTSLYELVWFNEILNFDRDDFNEIIPDFNQLISNLEAKTVKA